MTTHTEVLVTQPTAAPTRKIAAVGIAGLVAPILAAALVTVFPDLSGACGDEMGMGVAVLLVGLIQGGATFAVGYKTRNAVTQPVGPF